MNPRYLAIIAFTSLFILLAYPVVLGLVRLGDHVLFAPLVCLLGVQTVGYVIALWELP